MLRKCGHPWEERLCEDHEIHAVRMNERYQKLKRGMYEAMLRWEWEFGSENILGEAKQMV